MKKNIRIHKKRKAEPILVDEPPCKKATLYDPLVACCQHLVLSRADNPPSYATKLWRTLLKEKHGVVQRQIKNVNEIVDEYGKWTSGSSVQIQAGAAVYEFGCAQVSRTETSASGSQDNSSVEAGIRWQRNGKRLCPFCSGTIDTTTGAHLSHFVRLAGLSHILVKEDVGEPTTFGTLFLAALETVCKAVAISPNKALALPREAKQSLFCGVSCCNNCNYRFDAAGGGCLVCAAPGQADVVVQAFPSCIPCSKCNEIHVVLELEEDTHPCPEGYGKFLWDLYTCCGERVKEYMSIATALAFATHVSQYCADSNDPEARRMFTFGFPEACSETNGEKQQHSKLSPAGLPLNMNGAAKFTGYRAHQLDYDSEESCNEACEGMYQKRLVQCNLPSHKDPYYNILMQMAAKKHGECQLYSLNASASGS